MPAIGITGGISTGKSTFCECLREILPNAKFFDADRAARDLVETEDVKRELIRQFGKEIFVKGDLNRAALRAIVFADAAKKGALEKILHPRIRRQWSAEAETHRQSPDYFFADIPLLYETGGETLCDQVVVVACSPDIQLASFLKRSKLDEVAAKKMIASQMPLEEKMKRANHVVWNNGGRDVLTGQAQLLVDLWRQEKMDESITNEDAADTAASTAEIATDSSSPGSGDMGTTAEIAAEPAAAAVPATKPPRDLDLNELQTLSTEELAPVAREFGLHLHPARTRHHHIFDLIRAALGRGSKVTSEGFLDQVGESFGLLRSPELNFLAVPEDVCVSRAIIQQFHLRPAQKISGTVRLPRDRERGLVLDQIISIEDEPTEKWNEPPDFEKLTPQFPQGRIMLENSKTGSISARAIDLLAPLGRGQRGLIVAPPRVGKTILLKEIAKAIRANHSEIVLILLLVDERPEEVTDLKREIDCQIYHSNFDESVHRHVEVAEMTLERAKRLMELKKDVVILLDSLTRLSRGYNHLQPSKGRIMSGGVEAKALTKPKKFFGSARNAEEGGSLTILATALIETGSRMDELIFEEFKGTGNMELHLDRSLQEKRLYPAIHPLQSATRREELLYHPEEWERVQLLRKTMATLPPIEAMEKLLDNLHATKTNAELLLAGLK